MDNLALNFNHQQPLLNQQGLSAHPVKFQLKLSVSQIAKLFLITNPAYFLKKKKLTPILIKRSLLKNFFSLIKLLENMVKKVSYNSDAELRNFNYSKNKV